MRKTLLSIFTLVAMNTIAQDCSDLFISEYVEGPAQNNAIEIYNPTSSSIDLSGYSINRYSNGATSASEVWPLSGAIAAGQAIAIGNGQLDSIWVSTYWSTPVDPVFYTACGMHCSGIYPTPFYFNGDDALTLEKGTAIIDIFGKVGEDPGGAWTDDASAGYTDANGGTWWTKRQTLIRKPSVKKEYLKIQFCSIQHCNMILCLMQHIQEWGLILVIARALLLLLKIMKFHMLCILTLSIVGLRYLLMQARLLKILD